MSPRNEAKIEGLSPHLRNILVTKHLPMPKRPSSLFFFFFLNPLFFSEGTGSRRIPKTSAEQDVFLPGHVLGMQTFLSRGHSFHKAQVQPAIATVRDPPMHSQVNHLVVSTPSMTFDLLPLTASNLQTSPADFFFNTSQTCLTACHLGTFVLFLLSEMFFFSVASSRL